ncbi:MAG: efflux RND transporter periplasmic adaptor subunit [Acidipila sp.]|nr:efflux RND transporter periplasmic adaptor subunit [Acidipila sp.]
MKRTNFFKNAKPWPTGVHGGKTLAVAASALALLLAGCSKEKFTGEDKMTSYSASQGHGDPAQLFTVPPEQMSHLQIVTLVPGKTQRILRLTGAVAYNGFKTTPVITAVGGPVARILVVPGDSVRAGQPLLYVHSPDFALLRSGFLKTRQAYHLADKNYSRAQDLYAHKAIAERDLLQAESDRNQAKADMDANEQTLRILGVPNPEELAQGTASPEIPLRAPQSGEIVERLVAPGQLLQAGVTQTFTISDTSSVWVLVNVYQNDMAYVHPGDQVTLETDAYPDVFHGKISYIAPALDPNTRTLQARIVTDNPGRKLKRDMYITATVRAGVETNTLSVPDAAILRDTENKPFVYVASGENQFGRRLVTVGSSQDGKTEILTGVKAGERVVGDGSLFLQFANSLQH